MTELIQRHIVDDPNDFDQLVDLFRAMTGREPTPEDMVEARQIIQGSKASAAETADHQAIRRINTLAERRLLGPEYP